MSSSKKLTSRDLAGINIIDSAVISPNGKTVIFAHKNFNLGKNQYHSKLCAIPFEGSSHKNASLTNGPNDNSPQYSPNGNTIAFLRKTAKYLNIFLIPQTGGKARQLTSLKNKISSFAWNPNGNQIAFTAFVPEKGLSRENEKPGTDPYQKYNADVKVIRRLWHKLDGEGFLHNVRSQIFLLDVKTGKIRQLTFGDYDAQGAQFSPDGKWIAFSSNRNPTADGEFLSHIYLIPAAGGKPKNLTPGEFYFTNPAFSPDGKTLAFIGNDEPGNWYANPRLWTVSIQGKNLQCLTANSDFPVCDHGITDLRAFDPGETPVWSHDQRKIYISFSAHGSVYLAGVDVKTKSITPLAQKKDVVFKWSISSKTKRAVLAKTDPVTPNDLWSLELDSQKLKRLTHVNRDFLNRHEISEPEPFTAESPDGTPIDGWVLKPPAFDSRRKHPAILEIHGGPMAMYSNSFFYEFQLLAHHGFVMVYCNPRGSMGYGQPFCEAIKGDWGNKDYRDLIAIMDTAIQKYPFIDENKLGVAGGSYGGFMTNWIIGDAHRFKAAVTMRSVVNEHSFYGTSDFGFLGEQNLGCLPWENPEAYLRASPFSRVENIQTPLLILHSEEDLRCPIEQAEQLYVALKKLKREAVFIRFPGESHDLSRSGKPWHRIYRLDKIVEWFKKHIA